MIFGRRFRVTDFTLEELTRVGVAQELVKALLPLKNQTFYSKREFRERLNRQVPRPLTAEERKIILKFSRPSLFRLEKIISNRSIREWVEAGVFALVAALVIRTFLFGPFKIPTGSMVPTIAVGDHIFATMFSYGVRVPFLGEKLFARPIERGDIVIFPYPIDPSVDYIKRVVAVGGDTIEVREARVIVNGVPADEPFVLVDPLYRNGTELPAQCTPAFGPVQVPPGKVFVMGDNRCNSYDSRIWGFVDASTVKGKGQIIYWSHDPDGGFLGGYRIGRIGKFLQ